MAGKDFSALLNDDEKYALMGLCVETDEDLPQGNISQNYWCISESELEVPAHWREWLGSIRVEELEACNLFLLSKQASKTPEVLDAESKDLQQRVWNFYVGLLLACYFAPAHKPIMLMGSRRDGEVDVRQHSEFDQPVHRSFHPYPAIKVNDIEMAAELGERLDAFPEIAPPGHFWRLIRTLQIYTSTRTEREILDRIHQFCRCIEGLILPAAGQTKQQFKSRTELFIGPRHHDMMGEIYDVRSAVEHLHENQYLENYDRDIRLDLVRKEAIVEYIARMSLARIVGDDTLRTHFANTTTLADFWALAVDERRAIWGDEIDPFDALADFDPGDLHDGQLGRAE